MSSEREAELARNMELRELWEKYQIDPQVAARVQELEDQGQLEERNELMVDYVLNHPAYMAALQYGLEHPEEAVPWREIREKHNRGRKRI